MNVNGYETVGDWLVSNISRTAIAYRGGKKYFLKEYSEYKMPRHDESTTPKLYDKLKKEFDDFMAYRIAINRALTELAGPGGNIILPSDWFVDDIFYVESTEFINNLIEDEDILNLPEEELLFVMKTAAASLYSIHRKNIVHSDLKRTNILAARNSSNNVVAKIIDFDRSYFANDIRPDDLGGDQSFMSPELTQCFICDMSDESLSYLSTKSDIFSLGLVFYNYLTHGKFPNIEGLTGALKNRSDSGKTVYCGEALLSGARLIISNEISQKYLCHLIAAMIQPEPEDRPSALEVLNILKNQKVIEYNADSQILIESDLSSTSEFSLKKEIASGEVSTLSKSEEIKAAKEEEIPVSYCDPWEEHKITFLTDELVKNGFVSSKHYSKRGAKCYKLFKKNGEGRVFTLENLMMLNLVKPTALAAKTPSKSKSSSVKDKITEPTDKTKKTKETESEKSSVVVDENKLWDEDAEYDYNMHAILSGGYKGIFRSIKNDKKGYTLVKNNDDQRFITFDKLKLLGYVTKK